MISDNVRLAHSGICMISDNVDGIKLGSKSGTKLSVLQHYRSPTGTNRMKNYGCESLNIFITLEINKYIVWKCMYTV